MRGWSCKSPIRLMLRYKISFCLLPACDRAVGLAQWGCSRNLVVLVFNAEAGSPAKSNGTGAAIECRQPEIVHFRISLFYFRVFGPEGRIFRGLRFNPRNRKVVGIDPNSTAVEELVLYSRFDLKNVHRPIGRGFIPSHGEQVVLGVESCASLILFCQCLFFALQQFFEY